MTKAWYAPLMAKHLVVHWHWDMIEAIPAILLLVLSVQDCLESFGVQFSIIYISS